MAVQWRTKCCKVLLTLLALCSTGLLLCASVVPASAAKVLPVSTVKTALMAVVIAVPPTQVTDPLTGVKDNQTNVMWALLDGWVAAQGINDLSTVRYVQYPQSVWFLTGLGDPTADKSRQIGVANLDQLIQQTVLTGQPAQVVGYSQGASVITDLLDTYKAGKIANAPDPSKVSFVDVGNPNRPNGGLAERFVGAYIPGFGVTFDGATPNDMPYPVTEVAHEYSFFEDFPEYVLNPLADLNSLMGALFVHAFYDQVDLNNPNNIVTHDGSITDILVHTSVLPIMQPFYILAHLLGRTQTPILDAISGPLRVIIDSAYDRTTAKATPANFGNPFQHLDMAALATSIVQSVETLFGKAPKTPPATTFTQFPDLSGIVKALTTSPLNMSDVVQAMTQSAEGFLYGKPTSAQPSVEANVSEPVTATVVKRPKRSETAGFGSKSAAVDDSTARHNRKHDDDSKKAVTRVHKPAHAHVHAAPSGKTSKAGVSSPHKHESAGPKRHGGRGPK